MECLLGESGMLRRKWLQASVSRTEHITSDIQRGIIGLTPDDESNFDHIAQQCLLLCTDYVHQLVLSYAGKDPSSLSCFQCRGLTSNDSVAYSCMFAWVVQDVQGVHRNDLVKTMRGVFRENPKTRMSARDIGVLEAFSAKAPHAWWTMECLKFLTQ